MAVQLPAALKSADVQRFATRAAQLEKVKPIASYWLEYYVLQQILTRSLHNESQEITAYAAELMDKVEAIKAQYADEPAVTDDIAAQAYMEEFAANTLARAEHAQQTNTVTRQTADTLQAALTFYESTAIWGDLNPEVKAKIKFAKFHAVRIARALKAGQDPNDSNPKPEPVQSDLQDALDEEDEKLKELEREVAASGSVPRSVDESQQKSTVMTDMQETSRTETQPVEYFPPTEPGNTAATNMDIVPDISPQATFPTEQIHSIDTTPQSPPSIHPTSEPLAPRVDAAVKAAYREQLRTPFGQPEAEPATSTVAAIPQTGFITDDDAVMAAQKHARWAISALNFEDVPTAVKELKLALQRLGGM